MTVETFTQQTTGLRPHMLTTAQRLLSNTEDAEDVVQDVLLRLWQLRDKNVLNFEAMALTMLRNACIDRLRRRRPTLDVDALNIMLEEEKDSEHDERLEHMMKVVDRLPSRQRLVLRMHHFEGMRTRDIAAVMGASEVSVRQMLSRARRSVLVAMSAALALLFGIGGLLKLLASVDSEMQDERICYVREADRMITDETAVMLSVEQTMVGIFSSADVPDIDKQMIDILQ